VLEKTMESVLAERWGEKMVVVLADALAYTMVD
jgi:hypothetical protein